MITTINFHLVKACNFKCKFCYATFNDISGAGLSKAEQLKLIKVLSESGKFIKINFAGGEPTLVPHISELIQYAKSLGFETSIVTNASRIDFNWVKNNAPFLDILAISINSIDERSNSKSGRNQRGETVKTISLLDIASACHIFDVNLKINTVITQFNQDENLSHFINQLKPFRWKVLQATKVEGQNDLDFDKVKISSNKFKDYVSKNKLNLLPEIKLIVESESIIQGSYLMIDMKGRFFDSAQMRHNYSDSILEVGVEKALENINVDMAKFNQREGDYSLLNKKVS